MPRGAKRKTATEDDYSDEAKEEDQPKFKPRRLSAKPRHYMLQERRTKQQTLTQIDFVKRHVPMEVVNLNLIGDEEDEEESRGSSQRKLAKKSGTQSQSPNGTAGEDYAGKEDVRPREGPPNLKLSARPPAISKPTTDMAPPALPKTPQKIYKIEIPSSQTPPDSPFSPTAAVQHPHVQESPLARRTSCSASQSPVKLETIKTPKWRTTLRVESSVSWENEDSQFSLSSLASDQARGSDPVLLKGSGGHDTLAINNLDHLENQNASNKSPRKTNAEFPEASPTQSYYEASQLLVKIEIQDPDDEGNTESDYDFGPETQAIVDNLELTPFEELLEQRTSEARCIEDSDGERPQTAILSTLSQDSFHTAWSKSVSEVIGQRVTFEASTGQEGTQQESQHGFQQESQEDSLVPDSVQPSSPNLRSPPPTPSLSASQMRWIENDTQESAIGKRATIRFTTISQLLPDSLMFDSLPLPPFSQESFNEDD